MDRREDFASLSDIRFRARTYVCPYLMHLQWLGLWLMRKPVYWTERGSLCLRMPKGHGVEVTAWWPRWMVLTECWWHNNWRKPAWYARRAVCNVIGHSVETQVLTTCISVRCPRCGQWFATRDFPTKSAGDA